MQTRRSGRGLTSTEIGRVLSAPPLSVVQPHGGQRDAPMRLLLAHVTTSLLLAAIMLNSSLLLTGANQEKSSQVVEALLGKVRPWHLLAGKLIPLTGLALAQLTVVLEAALAANAAVGVFDLPAAAPASLAVAVVMLAVGFALFAVLFTVAGPLATSVEHAQTASLPLQLGIMAAAFPVIARVLPSPESLVAQVIQLPAADCLLHRPRPRGPEGHARLASRRHDRAHLGRGGACGESGRPVVRGGAARRRQAHLARRAARRADPLTTPGYDQGATARRRKWSHTLAAEPIRR